MTILRVVNSAPNIFAKFKTNLAYTHIFFVSFKSSLSCRTFSNEVKFTVISLGSIFKDVFKFWKLYLRLSWKAWHSEYQLTVLKKVGRFYFYRSLYHVYHFKIYLIFIRRPILRSGTSAQKGFQLVWSKSMLMASEFHVRNSAWYRLVHASLTCINTKGFLNTWLASDQFLYTLSVLFVIIRFFCLVLGYSSSTACLRLFSPSMMSTMLISRS